LNIQDGDAKAILDAMEVFSEAYPMYKLSKEKANILTKEIKLAKPKNVLEIGTFFGYSALNMAQFMAPGTKITCIEANTDNAAVARAVIKKGLGYDLLDTSYSFINNSNNTNKIES
jgi:predicted O-methyltransferase YrrM